VPITREQQSLEILPKATALSKPAQPLVELFGVLFERPWRGRTRQALRHGGTSAGRPPHNSGRS
jgi:hypothetical protein